MSDQNIANIGSKTTRTGYNSSQGSFSSPFCWDEWAMDTIGAPAGSRDSRAPFRSDKSMHGSILIIPSCFTL